MSAEDSLYDRASEVARLALACAESDDAEAMERLHLEVGRLETAAREHFQTRLRRDFVTIADKLERGQPLEPAEGEALDRLMAGASRQYVRTENDVEHWRSEIRRLGHELEEVAGTVERDLDAVLTLQSLCREAIRVVPDLQYWLSERSRIVRFEGNTEVLTPEQGKMLARVIRDMLASENR